MQVKNRLEKLPIVIDKVLPKEFNFPNEYRKAIEEKKVAEENVKEAESRSKETDIDAKAIADALLVKAKAEAKAQNLLAKAITNNGLKIRFIEKWDGKLPNVIGNEKSQLLLDLALIE
jgi:regulator of protease activity HflC (stomatin/prohibitin superfamily)